MMSKRSIVAGFAMFGLVGLAQAGAITTVPGSLGVDFRDSAWNAANYSPSFTVGLVTATAREGGQYDKLYQDSHDGLGVRSDERDEIDWNETLQIDFAFNDGTRLTGLWITDLFQGNDGGQDGENGKVTLTLADTSEMVFNFDGDDSDQGNGEQYIDFLAALDVTMALFEVTDNQGDEFSVAGFTTSYSVPAPPTIAIFGLGLLIASFRLGKIRD